MDKILQKVKVYYHFETNMDKIPESCVKCTVWESGKCTLPDKVNGMEIQKRYTSKRHRECPLVEVK